MAGYTFRRAVREHVPLIIGLSGGTGSGKTYSAMRLAKGMAGNKPFVVIDTENGRASHYAESFVFDVLDLRAPFRPDAYAQAIAAADKAGYPVIVVDSMSHEWAGDGGVLDWQEEEVDRMAKGGDWERREAVKMAAWIKPKMGHKHMMETLLQIRAHLILCFRAEQKIEMAKEGGKLVVRAKESLVGKDGWIPICEKTVPFEATCSFLLLASNPGKPHPIKLQEQHKHLIKADAMIDEYAGEQLAKWASGGIKNTAVEDGTGMQMESLGTRHPVVTNQQASDAPLPKSTKTAAPDGARPRVEKTSPPDQLSTQQASDAVPPLSHEDADRAIAREDALVEWKSQLVNFHGTKGQANALWKKVSTDALLTDEDKRQLYPYYSDAMRHATA